MMATCAIVGVNWGDEGKGRMVDFLAEQYDVVVRYQGGNNAGHTVINEFGESKLNLIPSGIFPAETVNLLGAGTVIDLKHIDGEIANLRQKGVTITPDNLKISDRAIMVLPFHPLQDALEEQRLGKAGYGSTKRGIAPVYGDKYMKKAIQMGDLLHPESLKKHLKQLVEWKNAVFANAYQQPPISYEENAGVDRTIWRAAAAAHRGRVCPVGIGQRRGQEHPVRGAAGRDARYRLRHLSLHVLFLAAVGLRAGGLRLPGAEGGQDGGRGEGVFHLRGPGPVRGRAVWRRGRRAARSRAGIRGGHGPAAPRAWIDLVATRYGAKLQAATEIVLTKLDVLSYLDEIPLCVAYRKGDGETRDFPYTSELDACEPVYETMPGWKCDISGARTYSELPKEARDYVERIEREIGCPISYVSVGAQRDALIRR